MPNMTLSIPEKLHKKMKEMKDVRWSEIARRAIEKRIDEGLSKEDKEAINWAVKLQRASRSGRLDVLKNKGLV
jgi:hypothetical protein